MNNKVIALRDIGVFKKDKIYTVERVVACPVCGRSHTECYEFPVNNGKYNCVDFTDECPGSWDSKHYGMPSKYFAPLTTQYADITAEIAAGMSETREVPDKVVMPAPEVARS